VKTPLGIGVAMRGAARIGGAMRGLERHRQGLLRSGKAEMLYRCVKHYPALLGLAMLGSARRGEALPGGA